MSVCMCARAHRLLVVVFIHGRSCAFLSLFSAVVVAIAAIIYTEGSAQRVCEEAHTPRGIVIAVLIVIFFVLLCVEVGGGDSTAVEEDREYTGALIVRVKHVPCDTERCMPMREVAALLLSSTSLGVFHRQTNKQEWTREGCPV